MRPGGWCLHTLLISSVQPTGPESSSKTRHALRRHVRGPFVDRRHGSSDVFGADLHSTPQRNAPGEGQPPSDRDRNPSFEFPPLPKVTVSLLGGTVAKLDPIRDRAVVRAFGGRDFTIDFDGRTKVMRAEMAISTREIRPGARIYADTIVVNGRIFAKTIRIEPSPAVGEVRGRVTNYDPMTGVLSVRDALSPEPLRVHITPETAIRGGDRPAQASQLAVGTLVKIGFRGGAEGAGQAQKVDILAQPGSTFTFAGKITFVDVRTGYVAIADRAEGNSYEVAVDRLTPEVKLRLKEGTDVIIHAQFDGQKYRAQTIEPAPGRRD